ncbi:Uncharacterised protein [Mycoplasmoides gallisepticum]|uniref:Uncharacterized protein n=1 Tax=Mycoplasmoides gallisepticum TaxID=2096 RepID=A0A3B0Q4N7_MYCGL|nr:Uncharacterised protein [Mycoplasmoides gallisepticum]
MLTSLSEAKTKPTISLLELTIGEPLPPGVIS